ncbi:MAG: 4Fe-4S binding protein [Defluviitaleaceae bacterium]|nr:4Fe-4S binding protein [Defluviitaleaceae bacterium]MCL2835802.1 4Fe-4S binding protein [Defluviitaleaceae bacterium]
MFIDELKNYIEQNGGKMAVVSIERMKTLQNDLCRFREETELNGFQEWIFNNMYKFEAIPGSMKSIIIVAVSRPAYAKVRFTAGGKDYNAFAHVTANTDKIEKYIKSEMKRAGYAIQAEFDLPLKRIAVQSGLAEYGKNNIAYVEGMGSCFILTAFSTEMPCENDAWRESVVSEKCGGCGICTLNCPTKAINKDRFLIDNQKCLSAINEDTRDFPEWLPDTVHHTPYDCLMCQAGCPMNKGQEIIEAALDQEETERLLAGAPYDDASEELKKKIHFLGLDYWPTVPRNLRVLFDMIDRGHIPALPDC